MRELDIEKQKERKGYNVREREKYKLRYGKRERRKAESVIRER